MDLFLIAFSQITILFLILILGFICRKLGVFGPAGKKELTSALINVVMPCIIINSFQSEQGGEFAAKIPQIALLLTIVYVVSIVFAHIVIRKKNEESPLFRICIIYSNAGFLGTPLLKALYGPIGEFCGIMAMISFNIVYWTYCGFYLSEGHDIKSSVKKMFTVPLGAVILSLIFMAFSVRLPKVVLEPISMLGNMNSPLAMLVTGVTLAECDLSKVFSGKVFLACLYKNLIIPIILTAIFFFLGFMDEVGISILVTVACPTAALVTAVAIQYKKPLELPSGIFTLSTILSMITLPAFVFLFNVLSSLADMV